MVDSANLDPATTTPATKTFELGVLFVHGIGDQKPGATLAEMGGPLVRWIHDWVGGPPNIEDVVNPPEGVVPIAHAQFGDVTFQDSTGPGGRARVAVSRRGERREWILAESRWAGSFHAMTSGRVAIWGLQIGAFAAAFHYVTSLERLIARSRSTWQGLISATLQAPLLVIQALVLAVAVQLLSVVVLVLTPFPGGPLAGLRERSRSWTASSVGDAAQLALSDIQYAAMSSAVRRDVEWLSERSTKVIIVAHSQGAAVAWRALNGPGVPEVDTLVTFGAGINKLLVLRRVGGFGAFLGLIVVLAAVSTPIAAWWLVTTLSAVGDPPPFVGSWGPWALGVSVIGLVAMYGLYLSIEGHHENPFPLRVRARRWIDLYASKDPVSNGPMTRNPPTNVMSEEILNQGSFFADHTSYWSNREAFVSRVGMLALSAGGFEGSPDDDQWVSRAARRRRWRFGVKRITDALSLAAILLAVAGLRDRLGDIGEGVIGAFQSVPPLIGAAALLVTSALAPLPSAAVAATAAAALVLPATQVTLGTTAVIGVGLILKGVGDWIYRMWGAWDEGEWMRRRPYPPVVPVLMLLTSYFGTLVLAGTLYLVGQDSGSAGISITQFDEPTSNALFHSFILGALARAGLNPVLRRIRPDARSWPRYFLAASIGFAGLWLLYSFVVTGHAWETPLPIAGTVLIVVLSLMLAWAIPTDWIRQLNISLDALSTRGPSGAEAEAATGRWAVEPKAIGLFIVGLVTFASLVFEILDRDLGLLVGGVVGVYAWGIAVDKWNDLVASTRYAARIAVTLLIVGYAIWLWRLLF